MPDDEEWKKVQRSCEALTSTFLLHHPERPLKEDWVCAIRLDFYLGCIEPGPHFETLILASTKRESKGSNNPSAISERSLGKNLSCQKKQFFGFSEKEFLKSYLATKRQPEFADRDVANHFDR